MVDFEPLEALLRPGEPDADLLLFVLKLSVLDNTKSIQILQLKSTQNILIFNRIFKKC